MKSQTKWKYFGDSPSSVQKQIVFELKNESLRNIFILFGFTFISRDIEHNVTIFSLIGIMLFIKVGTYFVIWSLLTALGLKIRNVVYGVVWYAEYDCAKITALQARVNEFLRHFREVTQQTFWGV